MGVCKKLRREILCSIACFCSMAQSFPLSNTIIYPSSATTLENNA